MTKIKMALAEARDNKNVDQATLEAGVRAITNALGPDAEIYLVHADEEGGEVSIYGKHEQWHSVLTVKSRRGDNFQFNAWGSFTDRFGDWYHEHSDEGNAQFMSDVTASVLDNAY